MSSCCRATLKQHIRTCVGAVVDDPIPDDADERVDAFRAKLRVCFRGGDVDDIPSFFGSDEETDDFIRHLGCEATTSAEAAVRPRCLTSPQSVRQARTNALFIKSCIKYYGIVQCSTDEMPEFKWLTRLDVCEKFREVMRARKVSAGRIYALFLLAVKM